MATSSGKHASAPLWLFDFDNTLVALEPEVDWAASRVALERYLRQAGVGDAIFREIVKGNLPLYETLRGRLMEPGGAGTVAVEGMDPGELLAGASAVIERFELRGAARAEPLPGAIALLDALRARGRAIAIVTSNSSRTVSAWLAQRGLTSRVDRIVGRDTLLPLKPAPAMVCAALILTAATAADAIFVGDADADAGAARAAGVAFYGIAATDERRLRLTTGGAHRVYRTPAELLDSLATIIA